MKRVGVSLKVLEIPWRSFQDNHNLHFSHWGEKKAFEISVLRLRNRREKVLWSVERCCRATKCESWSSPWWAVKHDGGSIRLRFYSWFHVCFTALLSCPLRYLLSPDLHRFDVGGGFFSLQKRHWCVCVCVFDAGSGPGVKHHNKTPPQ